MNILVATNLADMHVLMKHAIAQARANGARILLAHVIPAAVAEKKTGPTLVRMTGPGRCANAKETLEFAALQLQWQGILCDPFLLTGDPAEQIAALGRRRGATRILMGAARRAGHSMADRLMALVEIPVFVIGPQVTPFPAGDTHAGRILLPLSLRSRGTADVRLAARLARETGSRVALLHVIDPAGMTETEKQRAQMRARMQLAALAATEESLRSPIEIVVREGNVVRAIVEEARFPDRDCILLGRDSLRPEDRQGRGIAQQVIERARCPVITAHPDGGGANPNELFESRTGTFN
ncbi:MAG TPA: universal stress protein [Acidobacteriaceae bacterium]|nr:universal stress protein [Acidobacteriaceae bacterium]